MRADVVDGFLASLAAGIEARRRYEKFAPFKVDGTIVGNGSQDFTKTHKAYTLAVDGVEVRLLDCPGIEGNEGRFTDIIRNALKKCHLVCYVARESKGIETGTLEKIKSYLGANVEVMGIQNIPFNPQKEYDGTDYFADAKKKIENAARKAENIASSLRCAVPEGLYAKTISVSALPGLCGAALKDGESTFADPACCADGEITGEALRTLARQQKNFLRHATARELLELSRLEELLGAIQASCADAPGRIKRNALLRLKEKLKILFLDPLEKEAEKIKTASQSVSKRVDAYKWNLDNARIQMVRNIQIAVENAIYDFYREEVLVKIIYPHIERNTGIEEDKLNREMSAAAGRLEAGLKKSMAAALETAQNESLERIRQYTSDFQHGMELDFAQLNAGFPVLSGESFDLGDLGGWALTIGGYTLAGAGIGSLFPGIGNLIGAIAGFFVGLVMKVIECFMSDATKINRAKSKAREAIENIAGQTWQKVSGGVAQYAKGLSDKVADIMDKAERKKTAAEKTRQTIAGCVERLRGLVKQLENQTGAIGETPCTAHQMDAIRSRLARAISFLGSMHSKPC